MPSEGAHAIRRVCRSVSIRIAAFPERHAAGRRTCAPLYWPRGPRAVGGRRLRRSESGLPQRAGRGAVAARNAGPNPIGREAGRLYRLADFHEHPKVADGASELLLDVFGPARLPPRVVLGVSSIPLGMPVEIELVFEIGPAFASQTQERRQP